MELSNKTVALLTIVNDHGARSYSGSTKLKVILFSYQQSVRYTYIMLNSLLKSLLIIYLNVEQFCLAMYLICKETNSDFSAFFQERKLLFTWH